MYSIFIATFGLLRPFRLPTYCLQEHAAVNRMLARQGRAGGARNCPAFVHRSGNFFFCAETHKPMGLQGTAKPGWKNPAGLFCGRP